MMKKNRIRKEESIHSMISSMVLVLLLLSLSLSKPSYHVDAKEYFDEDYDTSSSSLKSSKMKKGVERRKLYKLRRSDFKVTNTRTSSSRELLKLHATETCIDSKYLMDFENNKGNISRKSCEFIALKPQKRCSQSGVSTHCPHTCGTCDKHTCTDSEQQFYKKLTSLTGLTCKVLSNLPYEEMMSRCEEFDLMLTCRSTCKQMNGCSAAW